MRYRSTHTVLILLILFSFLPVACSTPFILGQERIHSFDRGLKVLTRDIINSLKSENLYRIAINDFQRIDGKNIVLGKAVAEELITGFFSADASFSIVERSQLESAMEELQLGMSATFDESQAARLGKMIGADALVIGSITPFQDYIRINARIFSVEDGRVIAAAAVKIEKTAEVSEMLRNVLGQETAAAPSVSSAPESSEKPRMFQKIDDFQIELTGLRLEGSKLWADFLVTYRGRKTEEWIGFYDGRIVDSAGREYEPTHGGTIRLTDGWGGLTCVPDVPMIGTVPFDIGTTDISTIALLEIEFRSRGKVYFKNIQVR